MAPTVVTGVGLVTPLGHDPTEVLRRIGAGETAAARPVRFDPSPFGCQLAAEVRDLDPAACVSDPKAVRLMGRDALLAAAAARRALAAAGLVVGRDYGAGEIALFGATGLAGMELEEVEPLIRHSRSEGGGFDPRRFGAEALKRVRPILSFRILSNMPVCFVSIFEGIQGPNGVYNPWEGQGAQAIDRGIDALRRGEAACAVVGGCDAKAHALGFLGLEEAGAFRSWRASGRGSAPGEGAAFLVLEDEDRARSRGARPLARIGASSLRTAKDASRPEEARREALARLRPRPGAFLVSGEEGDGTVAPIEEGTLTDSGAPPSGALRPKPHVGNLFAASAAVQVGLAAVIASAQAGRQVLAACFGHGSTQAAFLLEGA